VDVECRQVVDLLADRSAAARNPRFYQPSGKINLSCGVARYPSTGPGALIYGGNEVENCGPYAPRQFQLAGASSSNASPTMTMAEYEATKSIRTSTVGTETADQARRPGRHAYWPATEEMLNQSGLAWTVLRNGFYAAACGLDLMGDALRCGVSEAPADTASNMPVHPERRGICTSAVQENSLTPLRLILRLRVALQDWETGRGKIGAPRDFVDGLSVSMAYR
jgi:hypothetical protein